MTMLAQRLGNKIIIANSTLTAIIVYLHKVTHHIQYIFVTRVFFCLCFLWIATETLPVKFSIKKI
jgi:hypothetical protein